MSTVSIIEHIDLEMVDNCTYCHANEKTRYLFHAIASSLTPEHFNQLLDLGWYRIGKHLYKPIMEKTCCPGYALRIDVRNFQLSRSQRRVLQNMNDFLKFGKETKKVPSFMGESLPKNLALNENMEICPEKKEIENLEKCCSIKKKDMRKQKALEKLHKSGVDVEKYLNERKSKNDPPTLEFYFNSYKKAEWKHSLEVRIVSKDSEEFQQTFEESFQLYCKYQSKIHNNYHRCTREDFEHVIISTPLGGVKNGALSFGTFYQQYFLDKKLIAVGLIDILPRIFSTKYFFYDPDYAFLNLGTYSVLREIMFTKQLSQLYPNLHYYHMGIFIPKCQKMEYKSRFQPSELLCPQSLYYVPFDESIQRIRENDGKLTMFRENSNKLAYVDLFSIRCNLNGLSGSYRNLRKYLEIPEEYDKKLTGLAKHAGILSTELFVCITLRK